MITKYTVRASYVALFFLLACSLQIAAQGAKTFVTVDAARYQPAVSPDSIVAGFSYGLTTTEAVATQDMDAVTPGIQLPTLLNGLKFLVNNREAGLLYVGPTQINYVVPIETEVDAPASVVVTDTQGSVVAQGTLNMSASNLSIFTNNQAGTGSPAALITADGITYTSVNNGDGSTNNVPPGQYLVLFGTGVRAGQDVKAFIGGIEAPVDYAGTQQFYVGLDQINIRVPQSLNGQGWLEVVITDGTTTSNAVLINVGGNPNAPATAPVITSIGVNEATAGQIITLSGSNFPTSFAEASVKIGSTPGQVVATTATAMTFVVPYGVASGKVVVGNATGERQSDATLAIKTSISGTVLNSQDLPMPGIPVTIDGSGVGTSTDAAGRFLLTGVPRGVVQLTFDTSFAPAALGLSNINVSMVVSDGRDNELGYAVYLPAITGNVTYYNSVKTAGYEATIEAGATVIEHNGLRLEIPGVINFPDGKTGGSIGLTRLPVDGRLPAVLPVGIYPSVAALITPMGATFGTKNDGLATLTFPNPDKFPAGTALDLYAYRHNVAPSGFVKKGVAVVNATGDKIVAAGLIDVATVWFLGLPGDQAPLTTVVGRVLDNADKPVSKARVFVRGRSVVTDKDGKFEIKGVRGKNGDDLKIEVLFFTPGGNPLKASKTVKAVVPGTTDAGDIKFPPPPPLSILIRPMEVKTNVGTLVEMKLVLSKPLSASATVNLTNGEGLTLDISPASVTFEAGKTEGIFKVKSDKPGKGAVVAKLAAAVDDATPDNTSKGIAAVYVLAPPPVLSAITPGSGAPGAAFGLTGTGLNPEAQKNTVFFKQGDRVVPVDMKTLKASVNTDPKLPMNLYGVVPGMRAGEAEVFVVAFRDGVPSDISNKLKFTVTVPTAPHLANITPSSGVPGATFVLTGTGLDPEARRNGIFFKQGDNLFPVNPEFLKILGQENSTTGTPTTIQGVVPRMPAGDLQVYAVVYRDGAPSDKSNVLAFKVTAPAAAALTAITPKEGRAGITFTITGSGFDPDPGRNFVFFKKGDRFIQLDPTTVKSDGKTTISGVVPKVNAGDYEVLVVTNLASVVAVPGQLPGTSSNALLFKVLPPPGAVLTSIDPLEGRPGAAFVIKGSGFDPESKRNLVIFKQGDRFLMLDPLTIKADASSVAGKIPDLPAGDYEIVVMTNIELGSTATNLPPGIPSNGLKFKLLPPAAAVLSSISSVDGKPEGVPGNTFKILGTNLTLNYTVVFKQGDKLTQIAAPNFKLIDGVIVGVVPDLPAGAANVYLLGSTGAATNILAFTVKPKI